MRRLANGRIVVPCMKCSNHYATFKATHPQLCPRCATAAKKAYMEWMAPDKENPT